MAYLTMGCWTTVYEDLKPYFQSTNKLTILGTMCLFIVLIFSPFYSAITFQDISSSPLSTALKNSSVLQIVYISGFASSFTTILDVILDYKLGVSNMNVDSIERTCIILSLIIPSCLYLSLRGSDILPYIYWNIRNTQFLMKATSCASIMHKLFPNNFPMHITLPILILYSCDLIFQGFITANDTYTWALYACLTCRYVTIILYIVVMFVWLCFLYNKQLKSKFGNECIGSSEYMASLYASLPMLYGICDFSITYLTGINNWNNADENILVIFQLLDILFTVLLFGNLPNQISRKMTQVLNCKLLDLKRTFVRYVSHEIRSPLNVVDAGLDVLTKELSTNQNISEDALETIKDISDSAAIAISILNDLLNYENIDAGTFKLELEEIPVGDVFVGHNSMDHLQMLAKARTVELQIHNLPSTRSTNIDRSKTYENLENVFPVNENISRTPSFSRDSFVNIDSYRLNQVIRNLVTNAIKFCPRGEQGLVRVTIHTCLDTKHVSSVPLQYANLVGSLRVEVKDNGAGIASQNLSKVFGEFSQVDKNKLQDGRGSGLGLWISRRIIQLHGGILNFTSEGVGKGCTFYLCLPIYEPLDQNQVHESNHVSESQKLIPVNFGYLLSHKVEPDDSTSFSQRRSLRSGHSAATIAPDVISICLQSNDTSSDNLLLNSSHTVVVKNDISDSVSGLGIGCQLRDVEETGRGEIPLTFHRLKILIVDDSALNRKFTHKIITTEPGAIPNPILVHADDGDIAVELVRTSMEQREPFHLVLMDSVMNNMHGPKAVRILRTEYNYTGIIIGVTGNALPDDINSFIRQGVDHVLTKPLKRKKLLDVMKSEGLISHMSNSVS